MCIGLDLGRREASCVKKLLLLHEDVTFVLLDMVGQHLQFGLLQPVECPSVIGIVMGSSDIGGCTVSCSFALTRVLGRFLVFLRPRHGLGTGGLDGVPPASE